MTTGEKTWVSTLPRKGPDKPFVMVIKERTTGFEAQCDYCKETVHPSYSDVKHAFGAVYLCEKCVRKIPGLGDECADAYRAGKLEVVWCSPVGTGDVCSVCKSAVERAVDVVRYTFALSVVCAACASARLKRPCVCKCGCGKNLFVSGGVIPWTRLDGSVPQEAS